MRLEFRELTIEDIIFEDRDLIAINKPSGLPTQKTQNPDKKNLVDELSKLLTRRDKKVPYLALHHRLDAGTSGSILLAKSKSINSGLSDLFQNRKIKKTYLAVADNFQRKELAPHWTVENHLKSYRQGAFKKSKSAKTGLEAKTEFKILERWGKYLFLECKPYTGRLHQIRVHLSEMKLPIMGDFLYNRKRSKCPLMLHAKSLEFIHPKTKKLLHLACEPHWDLSPFKGQSF